MRNCAGYADTRSLLDRPTQALRPEVLKRVGDAMKKVMADPGFRAQIEKVGAHPVGNSPEEFKAQIRNEIAHMKKLVEERHIKLDE